LIHKVFLIILMLIIDLSAINIGVIHVKDTNLTISMTNDISNLLEKYKIKLSIKKDKNSLNNVSKLINNNNNDYFAVVNKDAISYYNANFRNSQNRSIYNKIPSILSLGTEQIHIFTNINNEYDFDLKKDFNVYCGEENSDSCISAKNIEKVYGFKFKYKRSNIKEISTDLQKAKIDLFISVKKAPYLPFEELTQIKLIDLPTNFNMERIYINSQLKSDEYSFMDDNMHIYSVNQVMITNLTQKQYKSLIKNIIKVIVLNQNYLIKKNPKIWKDIDFTYFRYKKFLKIAKITILKIDNQIRYENALKF